MATQAQSVERVENSEYAKARDDMVAVQLVARDIVDPRVIEAMRRVPRHVFVPRAVRRRA
jgi:protein-L-isoaspartate(D-aspartate) O-methyltransferase